MNILHRSELILKKAINSYCSLFSLSLCGIIFLSQLSNVFTFPAKELFLSKTLKTIMVLGIVSNSCFFPLSLSACKSLASVATDMLLKPGCRDAICIIFQVVLDCFPRTNSETLGHVCMWRQEGNLEQQKDGDLRWLRPKAPE